MFLSLNTTLESIADFLPFVVAILLIVLIVLISTIDKNKLTARELTIAATAIAASFALNQLKVRIGANGGSVSAASIVPLALYCYIFGVRKGLLAAFTYSILKLIQGAYILGFTQSMLDYVLPYSVFGLLSVFKFLEPKLKGYTIIPALFCAYFIRLVCHTLAGIFYWELTFVPSLLYSLPYLSLDFAIAAGVLFFMVRGHYVQRITKYLKPIKSQDAE